MKQKNLQITWCLMFLVPLIGFSQIQQFNWAFNTGDANGMMEAKCSATDAQGNLYVAGDIIGWFDLDPGAGTDSVDATAGNQGFIYKISPAGNILWARSFGGSMSDYVNDIAVDPNGDVVIVGRFFSQDMVFPGTIYTLTSQGFEDIYVCKFSSNGTLQWAREFGSQGGEGGYSITTAANGDILFTGGFANTIDFDPSAQVANLTPAGGYDLFVCRLNSAGAYVNAYALSSTGYETGSKISLDASGNIYLAGYFGTTLDFDPSPATATLNATNFNEGFVAKYSPSFNYIWAKTFRTFSNYEIISSINLDANKNVYVTGNVDGTIDFDPSPATVSMTTVGVDMYMCKLDSNGNYLFHQAYSQVNQEHILDATLDKNNNLCLIGQFAGVIDLDPGAGVYNLGANGVTTAFMLKLNANGSFNSAFGMQSTQSIQGISIVTAGDLYYISGGFAGTADVNPFTAVDSRTSVTNWYSDFIVWQFNECMQPLTPVSTNTMVNSCLDQPLVLSATSGTATIKWYTSISSASAIATGTSLTTNSLSVGSYTYYAEALTCTHSFARLPIKVSVNPNPTVNVVSTTSVICAGESVDITASGADTYSWSNGATTPSVSLAPANSITLVVIGSTSLNCNSSASVSLLVNECTTISEGKKESVWTLFPSPSNGQLTVESPSIIHAVSVYNVAGALMATQNNNSSTVSLNLENLPKGIYLVVINNQPQFAKRVIIE